LVVLIILLFFLLCDYIYRWYDRNKLAEFGVTPKCVLRAYFLAVANIFEPDRAMERLAWARTAVVAEVVSSYLQGKAYDVSTKVQGAISELEKYVHDALTRHASMTFSCDSANKYMLTFRAYVLDAG
jgi:hypothetical protein